MVGSLPGRREDGGRICPARAPPAVYQGCFECGLLSSSLTGATAGQRAKEHQVESWELGAGVCCADVIARAAQPPKQSGGNRRISSCHPFDTYDLPRPVIVHYFERAEEAVRLLQNPHLGRVLDAVVGRVQLELEPASALLVGNPSRCAHCAMGLEWSPQSGSSTSMSTHSGDSSSRNCWVNAAK
jgi:hypothetical protein